ncbi:MAG: leucine-rich repeat protein [Clostridiales bacterium]|nr:leucine-rich repeat protein [Clostridiales bacterium]
MPATVTSIAENAVFEDGYDYTDEYPDDDVLYFKNWAIVSNGYDISGSCELKADTVGLGDWAFSLCEELEEIIIPDSVKRISEGAFYGCTGLSSVQLGSGIEEIGLQAFDGCSSLTDIALPDSLKILRDWAFGECGLTSVEIPSSVEEMEDSVFYGCEDLTEITILCKDAYIDDYAFDGCDSLEYVYCYKGSTADNADLYPENAAIIYLDDEEIDGGETAKGDVNGDDSVNRLDVVYILKDITNLVSLSDEEKAAADVNGDGNVDILDTIQILKSL